MLVCCMAQYYSPNSSPSSGEIQGFVESSGVMMGTPGSDVGNFQQQASTQSYGQSSTSVEVTTTQQSGQYSGNTESSGFGSPIGSDIIFSTGESSGLETQSSGVSSGSSSSSSAYPQSYRRLRRSIHFRESPDATTSTQSTTTTSFTTPTTTTIKPLSNSTCVPALHCFNDSECGETILGHPGRCIGLFHGTCDCTRCVTGLVCHNDSSCGGLIGACNEKNKLCNCVTGYKHNGFHTLGKALTQFCNHRACDASEDTCFGMDCRKGMCAC